MTSPDRCCGRPVAAQCRCYADAATISEALRMFIRRRVRHSQDAEDITQDALVRLYRAAPTLHDERALNGWMYQIARSAIIDHHRRAAARPEPADTDDGLELPAEEPEEPSAEQVMAACLSGLLDRLPEHYRTALQLTDLGGLTQERTTADLGLSTSGLKSRVQRGRRLLREEIIRCCQVALDNHGALAEAEPRGKHSC
jgi:RNA polymerase sigma-70 factor, ECF subfamily